MKDDIKTKVEIIKSSELFTGNSDTLSLLNRQQILLTLTGQKPLSEISTGRWVAVENGRKSVPEDHHNIEVFLTSLGLKYSISDCSYATDVIISLDEKLINQYLGTHNYSVGALFGYPKTAVEAFGNNDLMVDISDQEKIMEQAGLPDYMSYFRFSKLHYAEEIKVLKSWFDAIKCYGLL